MSSSIESLRGQDAGDSAFDTRSDGLFGDATLPLNEFLRSQHVRSRKAQNFCIVGYQSKDGRDKRAWIHWTEGHKIVLWRGAADPQSAKTSIAHSRRITDLRKDVVSTEADIKGSTYLVTKAWVDNVISECQARGMKYQVSMK